ncbi:hypothetical protein D3C84_941150 [compost metagenome]
MVDAAQAYANHQDHRQPQRLCQIRQVVLIRQWHSPATGTFDQSEIGLHIQNLPHRRNQRLHGQRDAGFARGQVRRNCRFQRHRIDLRISQRQRALCQQCQRIGVTQPLGGHGASGGHRFACGGAQARRTRGMQQTSGHRGFADIGVGTGDEISCAHKGFSRTAYTT